ncbi:MAG: MarR family transcriptional regulator, partial [Planctomycetota bacterium]
ALDEQIARTLGINRSDLRCLNLLESGPLSAGQIAKGLDLTTGSVTTLVDRLMELGFVERVPSQQDRRSVLVRITPEAFPRIGRLYLLFVEQLGASFSDRSADELTRAADLLSTFAAALEVTATRVGNSESASDPR